MILCPHCGASASAERHRHLRFRCGVCGGPVVPAERETARTTSELASLVAAQRAHAMALGWIAAAFVLGVIAAMNAVLASLLFWAGVRVAPAVLAAVTALAIALSIASALAGSARRAEVRRQLDAAWENVAEDVIRSRGRTVSAPELAAALSTDEPYAASLLSTLSSHGRAHARVRDDAELGYEVEAPIDTQISPPDAGRTRDHGG